MANPRKAWFVTTDAGQARPASVEGWILLILLVIWIAAGFSLILRPQPHGSLAGVILVWAAGAGAMVWVVRRRTGPPRPF